MRLFKLAVILPAVTLVGFSALADAPGPTAQRPSQQQYPQPYDYDNQYYQDDQQGQLPPPAEQYPQPQYPAQPVPLNPGGQYYCVTAPCAPPMPYPPLEIQPVPLPAPIEPPIVIIPQPPIYQPPAILPPIVRPPTIQPYPNYGYGHRPPHMRPRPRPVPYGGGRGMHRPVGPRPVPYNGARVRRMSTEVGCEIQRGNNGQVLVLSKDDLVLYLDSSVHAEENARAMKAYYEGAEFDFCRETSAVPQSPSEIEI